MKNSLSKSIFCRCLLAVMLLLLAHSIHAQGITINSIIIGDVTCVNNGTITINATGSSLRYELIAPSTKTMALQTSNVFIGLPAGSYTIAVYDDGVNQYNPVTTTRSIGGGYTSMTLDVVGSTTGQSALCNQTGRITVTLAGGYGNPNFTYQLLNASNAVISTKNTTIRTVNFDNLTSGTYRIKVIDCGNNITSGTIVLSVPVPPFTSRSILGVVSGTLQTEDISIGAYSATASCDKLNLFFSSITLGDMDISQYPGLRFRVVYGGTNSAWYTVPSNSAYPFAVQVGNFSMSKAQNFQIEIEHPCGGSNKLSTSIAFKIVRAQLTFVYGDPLFNPCTGLIDSVRYNPGTEAGNKYSCPPYTVTMVVDGKVYTINNENPSPYFKSGVPFTVTKVTDGAGADVTNYVQRGTVTFGSTSDYPQSVFPLHVVANSSTPFVPPTCDFTKGQVVFKPKLYMPRNIAELTYKGGPNGTDKMNSWKYSMETDGYINTTTFTITLTGGPSGYTSLPSKMITINKGTPIYITTEYPLWDNIPPGTYTYKVDVAGTTTGCSFPEKTFTAEPNYTSFTETAPVLNGFCGAYRIDGKATLEGTSSATTKYKMQVWRNDNTLLGEVEALSGVPVSYSNMNLVPGTYTVKYVVTDSKGNSCTQGSYTIKRPVYQPMTLNAIISCNEPTGTLTLEASNGEGTLKYRIKEKGAADNTYTPTIPQTSNVFENIPRGVMYTVEMTDLCGTYYDDVMVDPIPTAPTATAATICENTAPIISISNAQKHHPYSVVQKGSTTVLHKSICPADGSFDITLTQTIADNTEYEVRALTPSSKCESPATTVLVNVTKVRITTTSLPIYLNDVLYSFQLEGSSTNLTYSIKSGSLPSYISLSSSGLLTGTIPTEAGKNAYTFTVEAKDGKGCSYTKEFTLRTCDDAPLVTLPIEYCKGATAQPIFIEAKTGLSIHWFNDQKVEIGASLTPGTDTPGTQTYYVAYYNIGEQCLSDMTEVPVEVHSLPVLLTAPTSPSVCAGSQPILELAQTESTNKYFLYQDVGGNTVLSSAMGTGGHLNLPSNTNIKSTTSFYVGAVNEHGCKSASNTPVQCNAIQLTIAPDQLPPYRKNMDYEVKLQSNAAPASFSLISGTLPKNLELDYTGLISGRIAPETETKTLPITVEVSDPNGCKASKEYVLRGMVYVPQIFTPNGDGINDYFMKEYHVVIFNRLGVEVFKGDDGWDGSYNGKAAPSDIYFYTIQYKDEQGEDVSMKGYVGLKRD